MRPGLGRVLLAGVVLAPAALGAEGSPAIEVEQVGEALVRAWVEAPPGDCRAWPSREPVLDPASRARLCITVETDSREA